MRQGLISFWNKMMLGITKWPEPHLARLAGSRDRANYNSYLLPAPFLAFGLVIGKCDSNPCDSFTRIPPCAPKCSKDDLNSIKMTNYSSPPSTSSPKNCPTPSSVLGVGQEEKEKKNAPEELTHHFLLKQAATVMIDSVTRLLTQTVSALDDYHHQYREMMGALFKLLEESRMASTMNQELINCKMIVLRSQMEDIRQNLNEIELFLSSVEVLVNQTAQTSDLARAEYPSLALSERLQSAMLEVGRIKALTKDAEGDLVQLQAVIIVESGKSLK